MDDQGLESRQAPRATRAVRSRNSVDLGGFFAILRRRFRMVALGIVLCMGLAGFYIVATPLGYTSTVSLLVDTRERAPLGSDAQNLPQTPDPVLVESLAKLIVSDAVMRRVVVAEGLEADPEFAPKERSPGILDPIVQLIDRGRVAGTPMDQIVDALTQRVTVKRSDRTYIFDVDVRGPNPTKAARLADAIADAFIAEQRAAADGLVRQQTDWVVKRTSEMRDKVEMAEKKAQDFKAANGIINVGGTLNHEQQLQDANRDVVAARAKTAEAQSRYEQVRKIISSGHALDGTYDTINSTVIRQLRVQYSDLARREAAATQKYGTRHPEYLDIQEQLQAVRQQITGEMQRVASALANEVQVAKGNEEASQRRVVALETKTTSTNETMLQLKELEREAESNRVNYEKFLRVSDAVRRDIVDSPNARKLASATVPSKPTTPRVVPAILIGLSAGLSLGIGLAISIDHIYPPQTSQAPRSQTVPPNDGGPGPGGPRPPEPRRPLVGTVPPGTGPRRPWFRSFGRKPDSPKGEASSTAVRVQPKPTFTAIAPLSLVPLSSQPQDDGVIEPSEFQARPFVGSALSPTQSENADAEPVPVFVSSTRLPASPEAIDPGEMADRFVADLDRGAERRILLTGLQDTPLKSLLAMRIARTAALAGHAVMVVDADPSNNRTTRAAVANGLPATIEVDGAELSVYGIPGEGDGVVFVLPQSGSNLRETDIERPFIQCHIAAVIVDGPRLDAATGAFEGLADECLCLDDDGRLRPMQIFGRAVAA